MMIGPGIVIGFLAGLSAGAIMGILFAPKKGEETRRELKEKAMAARNRMQQQMAMQKGRIKRTADQAAGTAKEAVENAKEMGEEPSLPR